MTVCFETHTHAHTLIHMCDLTAAEMTKLK